MKTLRDLIVGLGMFGVTSLGVNEAVYAQDQEQQKKEDETAQWLNLGGLVLQLGGLNPDLTLGQRQLSGVTGNFLSEEGRKMHELKASREGRDQIIINQGPQDGQTSVIYEQKVPENLVIRGGNYLPAPGYVWDNPNDKDNLTVIKIEDLPIEERLERAYDNGNDLVFSCKYYHDSNGNGVWEFDEFNGIKGVFNSDEKITIVSLYHNRGYEGRMLELEVLNDDGETVIMRKVPIKSNDFW
ncbi:MAG: hypothetical protein AABY22_13460, partial [Nanoarchaeota archaeon]